MPIKWSAVKVSEVMDEVESQINLVEGFVADAEAKVEAARRIDNLPGYLDQHLIQLSHAIERIAYIKQAIDNVRDAIPDGAIAAEQGKLKHGSQKSLM
jgi:hypothetical protein